MLVRSLTLKIASWRFTEWLVRKTFLLRPLVRRFIAGESLESAIEIAQRLTSEGYWVTLDYLGENVRSREEAEAAALTFQAMLRRLSASCASGPTPVDRACYLGAEGESPVERGNISIKLTQCGLDLGDDVALEHYRSVTRLAAELQTFVRVDMEHSAYTERTLQLVEKVFAEFPCTGTVLQSYLHRTGEDLDRCVRQGIRLRLVKGAYLEPASVAITDKAEVDRAFEEQSKKLLLEGKYPAIATHDAKVIESLLKFIAEKGIDKRVFEFQMLYGIRRDLQAKLLSEGYNVRVYVPFGESWYPYFTRRLAERPANLLFIVKALFKG
ncbi:MAG: proline dehydrogenase family protein [Fimbriimonadaceae bacterium]|nr:MAG: L-proline dehydrogenase [Armatimonadetes bacterium OLB18]RIJ99382.1 MAG: proline dehydrogenase [Armatimonadota bacterium]WKZ80359.1 MAG: proline dehydrogenase family protein [Fimbriimonadaceae bacterium]